MRVDSSAVKAMFTRDGSGKMKHLDVGSLWVHRGLKIKKEEGANNPVDLGTKAHPVARFEKLRSMVGMMDCSCINQAEPLSACVIEESNNMLSKTDRVNITVTRVAAHALLI